MVFPWSLLLRVVLPAVPEIISTVKAVKQNRLHTESLRQDGEARIRELEQSLEVQLQLIEKLASQLAAIQKILRRVYLVAVSALGIALIALGILFFG